MYWEGHYRSNDCRRRQGCRAADGDPVRLFPYRLGALKGREHIGNAEIRLAGRTFHPFGSRKEAGISGMSKGQLNELRKELDSVLAVWGMNVGDVEYCLSKLEKDVEALPARIVKALQEAQS